MDNFSLNGTKWFVLLIVLSSIGSTSMVFQSSKAQTNETNNNTQPNSTNVSGNPDFDLFMSRMMGNASPTTGNRTLDRLILTYLTNLSSTEENVSATLFDNSSRVRLGQLASLGDTVSRICDNILCTNPLTPRVTVTFDSITVNNDHDHCSIILHPLGGCSGSGEWDLWAYVQGQIIDLTAASNNKLNDVDDGDTIYFKPGSEVTVQIPNSLPLSIFTIGGEHDYGPCCGFCGSNFGSTAEALDILKNDPSTWHDAIHEYQKTRGVCAGDDAGPINKIYNPPDWGQGVHSRVVSDTGDFILRYTISVTPGPPVNEPDPEQCKLPIPTTGVSSSPSQNTFPPTNAIDNNFNTKWWSTNTLNPFITLDLGTQKPVCGVDIAWADGNAHPYKFKISLSNDGTTFTDIVSGISKGTTTATEKYLLSQVTTAKFVKVTITQSTQGSINSIAQISEINALGMSISGPGGGSNTGGNTGGGSNTGGNTGGGSNPPPLVIVPNVNSTDAGGAKQIILQAGLVPKFSHPPQSDSIVTGQSPQAGQSVPPGTTVTMTLHEEEPNCGPNPC